MRRRRQGSLTEEEATRFLEVLYESGNVLEAAFSTGRSRQRFYELRDRDAGFAEKWACAEATSHKVKRTRKVRRAPRLPAPQQGSWLLDLLEKQKEPVLEDGVYVVTDGNEWKIGFTSGLIQSRISGLQVGNPRELQLIYFFCGASEAFESYLHNLFASYWVRGEWFRPEEEVRFVLKGLDDIQLKRTRRWASDLITRATA